jgi:hypothetical protein
MHKVEYLGLCIFLYIYIYIFVGFDRAYFIDLIEVNQRDDTFDGIYLYYLLYIFRAYAHLQEYIRKLQLQYV